MFIFLLEALLFSASAGIIAAIYRQVLAYEPILTWWFAFGNRFENKWFFAPVWGCVKCISGQLALWFYSFIVILPAVALRGGRGFTFFPYTGSSVVSVALGLFGLLIAICGAILTAMVCARILTKLENK